MNYRTRVLSSLNEVDPATWNALVNAQAAPTPFMRHEFLNAMQTSGSATLDSGWQAQYLCRESDLGLDAVLPLYLKYHSYGEYVFDWAWADAYRRHGLEYYPKLLAAVPFTPVPGSRLVARDDHGRNALINTLMQVAGDNKLSSAHILFLTEHEAMLCKDAGWILRTGVQFHWNNAGYRDFDDFLEHLDRKRRKNIRAERRKVAEAGVTFVQLAGTEIKEEDWRFFKRCYDHTYADHHSTPYLTLEFFLQIGASMPENLRLIIASQNGQRIASSLVVHDETTLYGRYWGGVVDLPCLHFETAYYQALDFCIAKGLQHFEGGAQGEHKLARGFLPVQTWSAHWLAQLDFAEAVERYTAQEAQQIAHYVDELNTHNPYK